MTQTPDPPEAHPDARVDQVVPTVASAPSEPDTAADPDLLDVPEASVKSPPVEAQASDEPPPVEVQPHRAPGAAAGAGGGASSDPPGEPSDELPARPGDERTGSTGPLRDLLEWLTILGGALLVALVVTRFLVQAFFIPSLSMFPALDEGDRVLVNKLSYRLHDVNRGDLIVFERPSEGGPGQVKDLIKRVVGLPGERVEARGGRVLVDGQPLPEPYLALDVRTSDFEPVVIPDDHVFVMGDNRGDSRDSRFFGPLPEELVIGRAFVKVWPLDDLELL